MPWSVDEPPDVAQNWSEAEREKCVAAANAVLGEGGSDEDAVYACIRAAGKSESDMGTAQDFYLVSVEERLSELAENETRPVEVLRTGEFMDSSGKLVVIGPDDLEAYVASFEQGEAGQAVPIDIDHKREQAAGWVDRLWIEGEKLIAAVRWNDLGRSLVGGQIYRYMSATIDLTRRVIRSISLVNFPAVKGLQPVELRGNRKEEADMPEVNVEELREQIRAEERAKVEAELKERKTIEAELREQIRNEEREAILAEMTRHQGFVDFAAELCTGEGARMAVKPERVIAVLEALPDESVAGVQELLRSKVVQFGEIGSSREGAEAKQPLPGWARPLLEDWMRSGLKLGEFFETNEDTLGGAELYDLSEYQQ